jgi:hypothetical protein
MIGLIANGKHTKEVKRIKVNINPPQGVMAECHKLILI